MLMAKKRKLIGVQDNKTTSACLEKKRKPNGVDTSSSTQDSCLELYEAGSRLIASKKWSDLKITCRTREFHVHRSWVCPRSSYFERACSGGFKETVTNEISLTDHDPVVIEKLLSYLYRLDYSDESVEEEWGSFEESIQGPSEEENDQMHVHNISQTGFLEDGGVLPIKNATFVEDEWSPLLLNVQMYAAADYFDIRGLKSVASEKFKHRINSQSNFVGLPLAIREIYNLPNKGNQAMRAMIAKYIHRHYKDLQYDEEFVEVFEDVCGLDGYLYKESLKELQKSKESQIMNWDEFLLGNEY